MNNLKDIYRRLTKLLAIANDTRANPAEAAAAARQAANIMTKYQIDNADLIVSDLKQGQNFDYFDVVGSHDLTKTKVTKTAPWAGKLAVAIAQLNDAQAIIVTDPIFGKMIRFRGYAPDVEVCKFTYRYIVGSMNRAAATKYPPPGYYEGYISAVNEALRQALSAKQEDRFVDSRALVVIKSTSVTQYFGEVRYSSSNTYTSASGFAEGYQKGQKLNVHLKGVTNSNSNSMARIK